MATLTAPAPTQSNPDADDGFYHYYCCDENVAMCGVDLTGVPETEQREDTRLCPLCVLVKESGMPCPVKGCTRS